MAAELSGLPFADVEEAGTNLLRLSEGGLPRPASSTLNNDGTPLQVCVTARPGDYAVRLLGDPGANAPSAGQRVTIAHSALAALLGPERHAYLGEACDRMLSTILPQPLECRKETPRGILWLAASLAGREIAVYTKARWNGPDQDWARCRSLARQLCPDPSDSETVISVLREAASPVSVGLESAGREPRRLKLYWRLRRPVMLSGLGIDLLGDVSANDFLIRVLGTRKVPSTALVFSTSFSVATGHIDDAKIDICGHCAQRPAESWLHLISSLAADHCLTDPRLAGVLSAHRADVAFIGFGLNRRGEKRMNVYLKVPQLDLASQQGGSHAELTQN